MDQNNNGINGQATDVFTSQFTINTTDDGRFVTGAYHSLLGRAADTSGFNSNISGVELGNGQVLAQTAVGLITSMEGRSDLLYNGNITAQHPKVTGLFELLLGRAPSSSELSAFITALNKGVTPEQIIIDLTASSNEFYTNDAGGTDAGFVKQLFVDLLGRPADSGGLGSFVTQLVAAESNGRSSIALALASSPEYRTILINANYNKYLKRTPSPAEVAAWQSQFSTDEQMIAALVASQEFFADHGSNTTNFVNALYPDILNRPADPAGSAGFVTQLQNGVPRAAVAFEMLRSLEYQRLLITNDFTLYLGRIPTTADYNSLLPILQTGGSDELLLSTIIGSAEFYKRNANGATSQTANDQNWLTATYQALLKRAPDSGGNTSLLQRLNATEQGSRAAVVTIIVSTPEYRTDVIKTAYQNFLGRGPGVSEIAFWLPVVSRPSAGPGTPSPDEQFEADVLGSSEYFNRQRDNSSPALATNAQWLTSIYNNVLGRAPDAGGYSSNLTTLLNGFETQRLRVTTALDTSFEFEDNLVNTLFEKFLRRLPTPTELSQRITQLATGTTDENLINVLISSAEYFQNPTLGGNSNSTWLNQVYLDLLGRTRDAGSQGFLDGLNNKTLTRAQVAAALLSSGEYRTDLINRYYSLYLGRTPAPAEVSGWQKSFTSGATDEQVIAAITASNEYFELQHPYP
jgi:hypothetical protein